MKSLAFPADAPVRTVLCLGAHCDDVEIGCAGTLLQIQQRYPSAHFHWALMSGEPERVAETQSAAHRLLGEQAVTVAVQPFRGSYLFAEAAAVKDYIETLKQLDPDIVFTHHLQDRHQDHRLIAEFTWNTFRNHFILEYEIPKFEGDLGHPNFYVPIPEADLLRKLDALEACFPSQRTRTWFTPETFRALMRIRGIECNAASGYAEAFHARKVTF